MGTQREKIIVEGEDRASSTFKSTSNEFNKTISVIKKGAAILAGAGVAGKIASLGGQMTGFAIDAAEAGSAFETTFGSSARRAGEFVEEFANRAGFAEFELQQLLATTGNIVQGLGATEEQSAALAQEMAVLAGDVASFSNAADGAEGVLRAMQSATVGEREALKTYGIAVSEAEVVTKALQQTGKKSADELTRLEKAQATVALTAQKAGKAVGDLERTQDSAANRARELSAAWKEAQVAIGEALLPAAEAGIPILIGLADQAEKTGAGFVILGSVAREQWKSLRAIFGSFPAEAAFAEGAFRLVERAQFAGIETAEALARGYADINKNAGRLSSEGINELNSVTGAGLEIQREATRFAIEHAEALGLDEQAVFNLGQVYQALNANILQTKLAKISEGDATRAAADEQELWNRVAEKGKARTDGLTSAQERLAAKTLAARDATVELAREQRAQVDPMFRLAQATSRRNDALERVKELEDEAKTGTVEFRDAVLDAAQAQADLRQAAAEMDAGLSGNIDAFRNLLESMGLAQDVIDELIRDIQRYNDTPIETKTFTFRASGGSSGPGSGGGGIETPGGIIGFAEGGTVPGSAGAPRLILAHGQEEVLSNEVAPLFRDLLQILKGGLGSSGEAPSVDQSRHLTINSNASEVTSIENAVAESQLLGMLI